MSGEGTAGGDEGPGPVIDERLAERRREVRRQRQRRRRRRTITVVTLLVVLGVLYAVERSPLVGLEEIEVVGVDRLDEAEVRDAAGLELGTSTLRLRLGRVEERVEELPAVRDAQASRADPLTVRIEVTERVPVLEVRGGGATVLVDRDGMVLAEGGRDGLPQVRLDGAPPAPGEAVDADPALANAFNAWRWQTGPLRAQIVRFDAAGPTDLTLQLADGPAVRFGRAARIEEVEEKARALGAILEDVGDTDVAVIDVRAPSAPFVEP